MKLAQQGPNSTKSSRAASTIVWPSASLAGRPRRPWLFSVTTIPVLDSILILELPSVGNVQAVKVPGGLAPSPNLRKASGQLASTKFIYVNSSAAMDWDRVRIFLEVARTGQIRTAAKRLKVNQATVARQVTALEVDLQSKLLDRTTTGSTLTPSGIALFNAAMRAEYELLRIGSQLASDRDRCLATIRVGAPDGFSNYFLAEKLGAFAIANPALTVRLLDVPGTVPLEKTEADILVTQELPRDGSMICTKLTDFTLSIYGSESYLKNAPPIVLFDDLSEHMLVTYKDDAIGYLSSFKAQMNRRYECGSVVGQIEAVRAGHGVGVLYDYAATRHPELQRILSSEIFCGSYWLLSHPDRQNIPSVREVHQYLVAKVREARKWFSIGADA